MIFLLFSFLILVKSIDLYHHQCEGEESVLFGDECVSSCPQNYVEEEITFDFHGSNITYSRCFYKPPKRENIDEKDTCDLSFISMFFSWVAYDVKPGKTGTLFSSSNEEYKRLYEMGCGEWKIVNILENDHLDDMYIPRRAFMMVVTNEKSGQVLLVFRGTEDDFFDWVSNLAVKQRECPFLSEDGCGYLHEGFLQTYKNLQLDLHHQLKYFMEESEYEEYIFTGHSQGGATTQIAAFDFAVRYPEMREKMRVYNYGSPKVGNLDFVKAYDSTIENSFRFVAEYVKTGHQDLVTGVPVEIKFSNYNIFGGGGGKEEDKTTLMDFYHTKNEIIVVCEKEFFGNFDTIPGIEVFYYHEGTPAFLSDLIPYDIGCHFQQVYTDGILKKLLRRRKNQKKPLLSQDDEL